MGARRPDRMQVPTGPSLQSKRLAGLPEQSAAMTGSGARWTLDDMTEWLAKSKTAEGRTWLIQEGHLQATASMFTKAYSIW